MVTAGLLLGSSLISPVRALSTDTVPQDGMFHVVDYGESEAEAGAFETWQEALDAYNAALNDYNNLAIVHDGKVMQAEYGIALFSIDDACDYSVTLHSDPDDTEFSVNGCYGIDAAFLTTSDDGNQAEIMISGARAWADLNDLTIVPIHNLYFRLSSWTVQEGELYHEIKNEISDDYYASIIDEGAAPSQLEEGSSYYSYDGHYFYSQDALWNMLDDLKNNVHDNAVNNGDPWYDYYQYVSSRTLTTISLEQMEKYLRDAMGITGPIIRYQDNDIDSVDDTLTTSQYYGTMEAFYQYQYQYGANALMMLALSENESAYGRSSLSFTRNNLFGHAAYDTDEEANASRYLNVTNSIYAHARYYISGSYASPVKTQFHGSFFGNKAGGMNVMYSADPYWGEKAASYYRKLDEENGGTDLNSATLAIRTEVNETKVYDGPEGNFLYDTGTAPDMAFTVLGYSEDGSWLEIQSEATRDDEGKVDLSYDYDYSSDTGWIQASDVQKIIEGNNSTAASYVHVTFDAAGGTFAGKAGSVSYAMPSGNEAACTAPLKDHAVFTGWDGDTGAVTGDTTFTAQYRDVDSITLSSIGKTNYEINDRIDLTNVTISVKYADGTSGDVQATTSMITGFDLSQPGSQEVTVTYGGCSTSYPINVSEEKDSIRAQIKQEILDIIDEYQDWEVILGEDGEKVIALKREIDANMQPYMTIAQLRTFSSILRKAYNNRIRYIVDANGYDLGVSGMDTSIPLGDSLNRTRFTKDTYRVRVNEGVSEEAEAAMAKQCDFLGNTKDDSFTIHLLLNYDETETTGPLVFSISKPIDAKPGDVYTVLYYAADGSVEKCYTRQSSNKITFMANQPGEFMLTSIPTSNDYAGEDPVDAVSYETSSFDVDLFVSRLSIAAICFSVFLVLLIFIIRKVRRKKNKVISEQIHEEARKTSEDLDVTQAIHILDTQVLHLDEIQDELTRQYEMEKQQEDKDEEKDDQ